MIRSTSRSVLAGLVVVGGLALAGCGAGQVAQTAQQSPTVDGNNTQVGELAIRDIALEYPAAGAYEVGDSARLRMVVVNQGLSSDTLVSVSSPVADGVTISGAGAAATASGTPADTTSATPSDTASPSDTSTPSDTASPSGSDSASATPSATPSPTPSPTPENAQIQIPPNAYVAFRGDGPDIELTRLNTKLLPAQNLQVTLTFANAGAVTLTIGVATPEAQIQPAPTVSVDPDSESEG